MFWMNMAISESRCVGCPIPRRPLLQVAHCELDLRGFAAGRSVLQVQPFVNEWHVERTAAAFPWLGTLPADGITLTKASPVMVERQPAVCADRLAVRAVDRPAAEAALPMAAGWLIV